MQTKTFCQNTAPGEGKNPIGMFVDKLNEKMVLPACFLRDLLVLTVSGKEKIFNEKNTSVNIN